MQKRPNFESMSADAPDVSAAKLKAILNGVVDEAEKGIG